MPIRGFICPDGIKVDKEKCLERCRLELPAGRCKAIPFLRRAAKDKLYDGIPSTTQLLAGTREIFLKITQPYYIDPDKKTAAIIGSGVHSQMWYLLQETEKGEEKIANELLQGTYDLYDPVTKTLYDYKTWGVWKLAKVLSGSPEDRAEALFDTLLQMHQYKILIEEKYPDIEIKNLAIQVISREANLKKVEKEGVTQGSPLIVIPLIDTSVVRKYFQIKAEKLNKALKDNWAPLCTSRETWDTKKCQKFCEVQEICYKLPIQGHSSWWELEQQQAHIEKQIITLITECLRNQNIQEYLEKTELNEILKF